MEPLKSELQKLVIEYITSQEEVSQPDIVRYLMTNRYSNNSIASARVNTTHLLSKLKAQGYIINRQVDNLKSGGIRMNMWRILK